MQIRGTLALRFKGDSERTMSTSSFPFRYPAALLALGALIGAIPCARAASDESETAGQGSELRAQLAYPEKFTEIPGLYDTISKQPLISALGISKAELLQAYDATEKPLQHRQSEAAESAGAHAPKALEGTSQSMMIWGPYTELAAGRYLVVYRFKLAADPVPI